MLVGPAACRDVSPYYELARLILLATRAHFSTVHSSYSSTCQLYLLFATGNLCPEPDVLTVGAGAFIAPGVDFFTH